VAADCAAGGVCCAVAGVVGGRRGCGELEVWVGCCVDMEPPRRYDYYTNLCCGVKEIVWDFLGLTAPARRSTDFTDLHRSWVRGASRGWDRREVESGRSLINSIRLHSVRKGGGGKLPPPLA
jgi:hypothetical protein